MTTSGSTVENTTRSHDTDTDTDTCDSTLIHDLQPMIHQLTHGGYVCTNQVMFAGQCFECVASQARFDQQLGQFVESFVIFVSTPTLTDDVLRELDQRATRYLRSVKSIHKPIGFSCDMSVTVIAIVPTFASTTAPSPHFAPLLFDRSTKQLVTLDGKPHRLAA